MKYINEKENFCYMAKKIEDIFRIYLSYDTLR